ncbi:hypothetical protein Taro_055996, partial [Colocasia esculenta]|nr:hypothetical protein [Colocasia esculenta]
MAVTYGPLVVNNHAKFGYLATPIVFGDFSPVIGSPFLLGVVPAHREEDVNEGFPIHKSTKKNCNNNGRVKARSATINKGTQMPVKNDAVKGGKPHSTQVRTYTVHMISSTIVAPIPSQRGQYKRRNNKRPPAAISRSGKSIMIGNVRVRLDGTPPTTPRDRYVSNIPTSNRFSALRWFRGKHEDSMVEAGAKQKTRRFTKLKKIWVPKKETRKFEDQANTSKTVCRTKNVNNNPLQDAGFEHSRGRKRKGMYRKSNYIFQGPENTRVNKQTSTQQSKARISVFDRISRIPIFDKLRATPSTPARPSKRRRVTWAAQEKPRLIIFSCYATGMESSEIAEQIAEATPNISTGESGPSTSAGHPVIDLPTKEIFQAMSDDDKYEVIQQWRSEMTSLLNKMRHLATTSHRQFIEPVSLRHQQSQHPDGFISLNNPTISSTGLLPQATGPDINDPANIMPPQMDAFQNIAVQRHEIKKMVEDMFAQQGEGIHSTGIYSVPFPVFHQFKKLPEASPKVPKLPKYDGCGAPQEHVAHYTIAMGDLASDESYLLRYFATSLTGVAFQWYSKLRSGSVTDWADMQKKFYDCFQTAERKVSLTELCSLKQKKEESAIDFIRRWRELSMGCDNPPVQQDTVTICRRGLIASIKEKLLAANIKSFDQLNSAVAEIEPPPNGPDNPESHSVNVINASSSGLPESEGQSSMANPYLSSRWYDDWHPLHQRSFDLKDTQSIFNQLKIRGLIKVFDHEPYISKKERQSHLYCEYHARVIHSTKDCPDLHDWIETKIREGVIDQEGNFLTPSSQTYDPSPEFQAQYQDLCEYYHRQLDYGQHRSKADIEQFRIGLFQYRNGISGEAAAKPISQQAEEFVDDYYQLPPGIVEEAINSTFQAQPSEAEWVTVGPRKSRNSRRPGKSIVKGHSSRKNILEPSSEQEMMNSLEALQMRNREKNRKRNEKRKKKKQMEEAATAEAPQQLTAVQRLQLLINELEEYEATKPSDKPTLDQYIPWEEIERKRWLRNWLLQVQHEALQEGDLPPSPSLSLFNEGAEITVEQLDSMFSSFSCYMVFIPPPKELQTSTIDTAAQARDKPTTLIYQRRPPGNSNHHFKKGRGKHQKPLLTPISQKKSVKPKELSGSSSRESSHLDQIRSEADDKILQQLQSLPVNITIWEAIAWSKDLRETLVKILQEPEAYKAHMANFQEQAYEALA